MANNRNYGKRGISYLKRNGIKATLIKALERLDRDREEIDYVPEHADAETRRLQRAHYFEHPYKISILVPVYETDPVLFRAMLDSVGAQTYANWELILADASGDESRRSIVNDFVNDHLLPSGGGFGSVRDRVRYVKLPDNKGIAGNTNEALMLATGDYVALLDHDDLLENTALFDIMNAIEETEQKGRFSEEIARVAALYSDEDKVDENGERFFDCHRKPDFDPVLLCTNNYICHLFVVDINIAKSVGGFRSEYDGAQDHDFILRCTEGLSRDSVIHVPHVLYHWRSTKGSTSENPDAKLYAYDAGRRAVTDHLKRAGIGAEVTDSAHLGFFEIRYDRLHRAVVKITPEEYRKMANDAAGIPSEEYILVLSEDLMPRDTDYIADMMSCMHRDNIGAVTGKIIGKKNRVESAGYDITDGKRKARFEGLYAPFSGYMHRADLDQLVDGFSPDCVLLRKSAVASFNDMTLIDGYDVYYTPRAVFARRCK